MTSTTDWRTLEQAPPAPELHSPRGAPRVVLDQRFDAGSLFGLRSAVIAHAIALGNAQVVEELALVAHELATNAVRHGGGRGRLRLSVAGRRLWCEVSDDGPGLPDPVHLGTELPAPNNAGGRGLWIARQMSDLTIDTTPIGTTITAVIPKR